MLKQSSKVATVHSNFHLLLVFYILTIFYFFPTLGFHCSLLFQCLSLNSLYLPLLLYLLALLSSSSSFSSLSLPYDWVYFLSSFLLRPWGLLRAKFCELVYFYEFWQLLHKNIFSNSLSFILLSFHVHRYKNLYCFHGEHKLYFQLELLILVCLGAYDVCTCVCGGYMWCVFVIYMGVWVVVFMCFYLSLF